MFRLIMRIGASRPGAARAFWNTIGDCLTHNIRALPDVIKVSALYLHIGPFAQYVIGRIDEQIAEIDSGRWQEPALVVAEDVAANGLRRKVPVSVS